jgi:hypothetical protein
MLAGNGINLRPRAATTTRGSGFLVRTAGPGLAIRTRYEYICTPHEYDWARCEARRSCRRPLRPDKAAAACLAPAASRRDLLPSTAGTADRGAPRRDSAGAGGVDASRDSVPLSPGAAGLLRSQQGVAHLPRAPRARREDDGRRGRPARRARDAGGERHGRLRVRLSRSKRTAGRQRHRPAGCRDGVVQGRRECARSRAGTAGTRRQPNGVPGA